MGWYIFIFWIAAVPFVVWKGFFEGPKVTVFLLFGFLLSVYWVICLIRHPHSLKLEKKDIWYWMWLLILTISSLFGVHPLDSIIGGSYRHQGVIFFLTLWLMGKTLSLFNDSKKRLLYKGVGLVVIVESLIVLYQLIFGKLYLGHPLGTLGEVNAVAGFLAIGIYFVFISYPKIVSLLPVAAIALMRSKSGILAVLPNLGYQVSLLNKKVLILFSGLSLLLVIFLFFGVSTEKNLSFFENRQTIWPLAIQQIVKKPLLGYGAESGEIVFNDVFKISGFPLSDLIIDRAHNLFLDVTIWSGLAGFLTFSLWLYFSFTNLKNVGAKLAIVGFLIFSMFQPLGVVHWILLFLIL